MPVNLNFHFYGILKICKLVTRIGILDSAFLNFFKFYAILAIDKIINHALKSEIFYDFNNNARVI
jgi:hypothetical protein